MTGRKIIFIGFLSAHLLVLGTSGDLYGDNSLPPGTRITAALDAKTDLVLRGTTNGLPITTTCNSFSASGTVPQHPKSRLVISPPTISGCTNSLGPNHPAASSQITTNDRFGNWTFTDENGQTMILTAPRKGLRMTNNVLPSCETIAAPSAAVRLGGSYNGKSTDNVEDDTLPAKAKGHCTVGNLTVSMTIRLSPAPGVLPPW